jgi:5'-nucleotidase
VAAAREAAYHGIPAAAFSHYLKRDLEVRWDQAADWVCAVLGELGAQGCRPGELWNVNLPHLEARETKPEIVDTVPELAPLPIRFREGPEGLHYSGVYANRPRVEGSDVDVCFSGRISRSLLKL